MTTALAANRGVLIRNRTPFEQARRIDAVLFDKTGTLTTGTFQVSDTVRLGDPDEEEILRLAAAVEANSEHPIAQAIAGSVEQPGRADNFSSITGRGAQAEIDGAVISVVSPPVSRGGVDRG